MVCSSIVNIARTESKITKQKKFFLWFAGVRGAMAFALAIKSQKELKNKDNGGSFLFLTLIVTLFTVRILILIYNNS